jgi:hypothetical protein
MDQHGDMLWPRKLTAKKMETLETEIRRIDFVKDDMA